MELRSILTSTQVSELPLPAHPVLQPSDSLAVAAQEMRSMSYGGAVICDKGKLEGIVTERDLLRYVNTGASMDAALADVMTKNPQTVTASATLFDVIRLMDKGGYRRLPVVDAAGLPVGIVDVKSIVHFLVEHFPAAVYNQAPQAQLLAKHREGA
jgi:CBS domain-containing protein